MNLVKFQSTLPLRGATIISRTSLSAEKFQSTLPLRGATSTAIFPRIGDRISIHAPLTGSDQNSDTNKQPQENFNPRSPYGERHSLPQRRYRIRNFNPRSPYGERPSSTIAIPPSYEFQSTLPLRGATGPHATGCQFLLDFNPRSPYGERRHDNARPAFHISNFNPRSPYGERL